MLLDRSRDQGATEAKNQVPVVAVDHVAVAAFQLGAAAGPPGVAAQDAPIARVGGASPVAVLDPLPDISAHVVKALAFRRE